MRFIRDIYAAKQACGQPVLSVEFFTPKTPEGDRNLLAKTVPALCVHPLDYCSVTYGAGGSTREKTLDLVQRIQEQHKLPAMAHLTCVSTTRAQIADVLRDARERGIRNILALRGDPPGGEGPFRKAEGGFEYAGELVEFIRRMDGFSVGVAGFPEGHIDCGAGKHADWQHLKEKVDQGADFVITQLFFENADFYAFRDHLTRHLGVSVPIVPGLISILSASQIRKFTTLCGARIPAPLAQKLEQLGNHDEATAEFGIEYATRQCEDLLRQGVPGLHFYTLNKAHATSRILQNLGLARAPDGSA
ncbi:MAG: methylenetetrahydrofolate reductase [NAD(P)H] [Verrucomicrobia bacterium]|nr:methylenetetrahydrofolate reductase [NAD(P)H] [Verrucomicrobiota bacterium]